MTELAFPELESIEKPARAVAPIDLRALALTRFGDWRPQAAALVAKFANVAFPVQTPKGYDEAKKALAEVRAPRYAAQNVSKASKSELAAVSKAVGAEEQAVIDALAATEAAIKAQIDAEDERKAAAKAEAERIEAERRAAHEARISTLRSFVTRCQAPGMTAERIQAGMAMLDETAVDDERDDFAADAARVKAETRIAMMALHSAAAQREAAAAAAEAQRVENARVAAELAAERKRIADEAAKVKADAEELQRKINAQAEREAKAERDAAAVLSAQRAESERLETEAEQKRAAALQTLEDAGTAILAAAPHVDTYLPPSEPAVAYEAPAALKAAAEPEPLFVTLDSINDAIGEGFYMRADFISETLGIHATATCGADTLYNPVQRAAILRALAAHVEALA